MRRWLFFFYGVTSHLLFLATFAWLAVFVGDLVVPKTIDTPSDSPIGTALVIDLALLALFAAQHSIMARPAFKRVWTGIVPQPIERSTYVLFSCVVTWFLMWQWRAMDAIVWQVETPILRAVLWTLFGIGWLLVPAVSMMIDHFDLFGTRQVWLYLRQREYTPLPFRVPLLYKRVHHPLYVAFAIGFWAIPTMTAGHLLFAGVMTGYMALAALIEERDLVTYFGREYEAYRQQVPMFLPRLRRAAGGSVDPDA
jgi:protein-S-isoprenylcysteine O-methyltransferase Ste14